MIRQTRAAFSRHVVALVVSLLVLAASRLAGAQVLYGSLTGNVTDSSGALLPGVQVVPGLAQAALPG